jgi:hypothetical protein
VTGLNIGGQRFAGDDGGADPQAAAALAAYATGQGSAQAALAALSRTRLLVPVVALPEEELPADEPAESDEAGESDGPGAGLRGEKSTEMALPLLIGRDGRRAVLAFTCLDALQRWRPDARPVPVEPASVWAAAMAEADAVVIDVAGPVPLPIEGAALEALAQQSQQPQQLQHPGD